VNIPSSLLKRLTAHLSTIMGRKVGIWAGIVYAQDPAWNPEGHDVGDGYQS
jgi:hypothetical protein